MSANEHGERRQKAFEYPAGARAVGSPADRNHFVVRVVPVSYTHLTLPTNREV